MFKKVSALVLAFFCARVRPLLRDCGIMRQGSLERGRVAWQCQEQAPLLIQHFIRLRTVG